MVDDQTAKKVTIPPQASLHCSTAADDSMVVKTFKQDDKLCAYQKIAISFHIL